MKFYFVNLFAVFALWAGAAFGDECPDLSHQYKLSLNDIKVKQDGCDSWTRFNYMDGELLGQTKIVFSDQFATTNIDDEHEKSILKHRWFWSRDRKTLIHDYYFESFYKKSGDSYFGSASETFSADGEAVRKKGATLRRIEKADGTIDVSHKAIDEKYNR